MCSLNWRRVDNKIILAFNRDESVLRPAALPPQRLNKNGVEYVMPIDPQGQGSWIAMNRSGFACFVLNDYQGQLKPQSETLVSRGKLIEFLAQCRSFDQMTQVIQSWPLEQSQPFYLGILSLTQLVAQLVHYDGVVTKLTSQPLPNQLYSSGDPDVRDIIVKRTEYVSNQVIQSKQDLFKLHQQHQPYINEGLVYSLCMHRPEAKSQSMTLIEMNESGMQMDYYAGSPCQARFENKETKQIDF